MAATAAQYYFCFLFVEVTVTEGQVYLQRQFRRHISIHGSDFYCSTVSVNLLTSKMNFTHSSRKSWALIRRLGAAQQPVTVSCKLTCAVTVSYKLTCAVTVSYKLTCAVAEVGKTSMCVHELSVGVEICRRARWLSSGFTASIIMWMLGWSSVDMTQALTTHGTAVSLSWRHVMHAALNFSLHDLRLRRLRIADHPKTRHYDDGFKLLQHTHTHTYIWAFNRHFLHLPASSPSKLSGKKFQIAEAVFLQVGCSSWHQSTMPNKWRQNTS